MKTSDKKFLLFFGGPFSQWAAAPFKLDGVRYNCAEQYMMAQKALLFKDLIAHKVIMRSQSPEVQKMTGRRVEGFEKGIWEKEAKLIVYRGNLAKFTQNEMLRNYMLDTGNRTIVEASPTDTIWGIGLSEDDPDCYFPSKWRGTNWLGDVLMKVRADLRWIWSF